MPNLQEIVRSMDKKPCDNMIEKIWESTSMWL